MRSLMWRLGRALYMRARGEVRNDPATNGEYRLIADVVASGAGAFSAFDVGANVGAWSLALIDAAERAGRTLTLAAFEPAPDSHAALAAAIGARAGVTTVEAALSDAPGRAELSVYGAQAGRNTLSPAEAGGTRVSVAVDTADGAAARLGFAQLDLVKIDAEGHDLVVLRGAQRLFAERRIGVAQFEYNHRWVFAGASLYQAFGLFAGTEYAIGRVTPARLEMFEAWAPELERYFECNYAIVRRDLLPRLAHVWGRFDVSNVYVTGR